MLSPSPLRVTIPRSAVGSDHAKYQVAVQAKGGAWICWKRYSEFAALREALQAVFGGAPFSHIRPSHVGHCRSP
jgi:hypothetical protein